MTKRADIPTDEILRACRAFHDGMQVGDLNARTPDETLADRYPPKVIMAKMEQLHRQGLIEYGVSLRTAWVVDSPYANLKASNPRHQDYIKAPLVANWPCCDTCQREHGARVMLILARDCTVCYGEDETGHDFWCPVCEYCCGC